LLLALQLTLLLLKTQVARLVLSLVGPYVQSIHEGKTTWSIFYVPLFFFLPGDSVLKCSDVMGEGLDFTYFHGVGGRMCAGGSLETGPVESVHAREDVELLAE